MQRYKIDCHCIWRTSYRSQDTLRYSSGQISFYPRISISTSAASGLPFTLRRHQFPIRVAFGMSINKSQGQSLLHSGINLSTPVFAHGQLYVALSRAKDYRNIHVSLPFQNHIVDDMRNKNIASGIIHEELDKFWATTMVRLNALDPTNFEETTAQMISDAKMDLKAAIANRFGNPIADSCRTVICGASEWNGYVKDKLKRKREEKVENGECTSQLFEL